MVEVENNYNDCNKRKYRRIFFVSTLMRGEDTQVIEKHW